MYCKTAWVKGLIFAFNFLIFVCGIVVLAVGVWSILQDEGLLSIVGTTMKIGVYILIASGAIVMMLAFLGCYGCQAKNKPAIVVYCTIGLIVAVLKTVGCIILYIFFIQSTSFLSNSYKTEYNGLKDNVVTNAWDIAQIQGQCCGLVSYTDWEKSDYYNKTSSFPLSCCIPRNGKLTPSVEVQCQVAAPGFIYEHGCELTLKNFYYSVGATTIVVILIELASVILMVWYYQRIP